MQYSDNEIRVCLTVLLEIILIFLYYTHYHVYVYTEYVCYLIVRPILLKYYSDFFLFQAYKNCYLHSFLSLRMNNQNKRTVKHTNDPNVLLNWVFEKSDEEESNDESDHDEDHVIESDHNSETEQELSESEDSVTNDDDIPGDYYLGKNGETKWSKVTPPVNIRTRAHNLVKHLPGPKGKARETKTDIEILDLFLTDTVINIIVTSTNIYIGTVRSNFDRARDARHTDSLEIRAFIGLLYLIGSLRCSRKNIHQLWDNSRGNGLESCYLTMSEKRFRFLLRCIRFDDVRDRSTRREIDKLAPIRELFELMVDSFQRYFVPSEYVTIDEQLLAFRGNCPFRQYIPNKPAKYGVKMFALVDAKTAYTINLETYVGMQPAGPYQQSNSSQEIVLRLVEPICGTNRNITGDNWFSSIPLANKLLREKKLTYVGTLRKTKREIPLNFLPNKQRLQHSSLFGFQRDMTLVSYCPKKNKTVIVLSTMHHDKAVDEETGEKRKPEMISFYNMTKVGVDLVDQICQHNNVARNTRRWPMVIFYDLLNIASINALCIYKAHHPEEKLKRTDFLQSLAWQMVKPQIIRRATIPQISAEIRKRTQLLLGNTTTPALINERRGDRGRCYECGRSRNKTTRRWCEKCENWTCPDHLKDVCVNCFEQ